METHFTQATSTIRNTLRFIARAGMLAVCGCGALHAQQDLEGSVPANWTASAGTLSISPFHYKLGTESLRWDWNGGSVITVTNPNITAADVTNFAKNTCDFWVWNGSAVPGGQLKIEFMNGAAAQYWFEFNLNYTGWRRAVRSYRHDMSKKSNPSSTFTSVRITAPATGTGSLFLDAVTWVGNRFDRIRDAQNPGISGSLSRTLFAESYAHVPTLPAAQATGAEIDDLNILRARWLAVAKGSSQPGASAVTSANMSFASMNIVEDPNGNGIRGKVVGQYNPDLESWPQTLARDYAWNTATATDSRDAMLQLASHLMDQGHAADSNLLPSTPNGPSYDYRDLPMALILMAPAYSPDMKQKTWEWFRWAYRMGDFWSTTWERDVDDIYLHSVQELGAILFLIEDEREAVHQLKGYKLYLDRFWEFSEGSEGGVKVDGIGFHHRSHYNNYMYAYNSMVAAAHQLGGTGFQISQAGYENLRLGFMTYIHMSAHGTGNRFGHYGNSLCGRNAMNNDTSFSKTALRELGELGGHYYNSTADPIVARAYNRRFGTNDHSLFSSYGTDSPDGFHQFNYSPLGIYRRGNWVASIRAPQRYFWSAEIWTNSNVYGRYQAYGALEMLYNGSVSSRTPKDGNGNDVMIPDPANAANNIPKVVTVRSGQSEDGWDWSQAPGTTTIALPHDQLGMKEREDVRSQLNFSGALAFRGDQSGAQSQSGLYAANFQESKPSSIQGLNHNLSFVWRKSWFCFDSQIVCLGSDISNQNATHPTVTTLFQGVLPTRSTATFLNGTSINAFPHSETVNGAGAPWLLDSYDTGYLLQSNGNLKISRSNQVSARHTGNGATTTDDFAKAWIDHGTNPDGEGYEYSVFPNTTTSAMITAATAHASAATKPYRVYQRDTDAHVVKWKASGQLGYAIFTSEELSAETQNAGLLMSVERPCLVMTQLGSSDDAWISVVDPDLNFTHPQAEYNLPDASRARTLDFTVHGVWTVDDPAAGTSIVESEIPNTTTIRVTTQHGLAAHVRLMPPPLPGAKAWVNLGTDWTDPANWGANWGGSPPADDPDTDIAVLAAVTVQPVLDGPYAVKGLTLDGGTNLSGGGNLTLGSGGVIATGTNNAFALANITLHTAQTWDIGLGNLTVSSAIAGPAGAVLTKAGSGSLVLSGTSTHTGGLTVAQGNLMLLGDQSAATGSIDQKASGTSLSIGNSTQTSPTQVVVASGNGIVIGETSLAGNADRNFAVTGSPDFATTVTNHGSLTVGRAALATVGSNASWFQHGPLNIIGVGGYSGSLEITDGGKFAYAGNSDIQLNPASENNGSALLTISKGGSFTTSRGFVFGSAGTGMGTGQIVLTGQGTLQISANIAELFKGDPTGAVRLGDGIIDTNGFSTTIPLNLAGISGNPGSLRKTGTGTLTLSGTNTYTGPTTITDGVLSTGLLASQSSPSGIGAAGSASSNLVIDGGTLRYTGPLLGGSGFWTRSFTIGANGAAIDLSAATGQLRINGGIAFSGNGSRTLTITTGAQGGRLNSILGDGNGGATTLVKNGSGILLVTGANTYTGPLQILAGTVQYGFGNPDGGSSGNGHSVVISPGAALTFRHAGDNTVTYNAPITGEGSVTMNHNNSIAGGSLTLGGNNSFTGGLTINPTSGTHVLTLKAGGSSALGSSTLNIGQYGQLDLNGHSNATGLLTSSHNHAKVTNNGAAATLTLHGSTTQTFGGVIQDGAGKLSIVKSGSGTQRLTGANRHSGDTTVTGGTLSLSQPNPNNESSNVTLAAGAVLELAFTGTDTVDKLFINGVQQVAGDCTQSHPSGTLAGAGTLRVTSGPSGYDAWAAANAPGQAADLDHDSDGVQNGIEFFMGLSGTGFTANPAPDANGRVTWPMASTYSGVYGTDYAVQTSTDLIAWSDVPQSGVIIVSGVSISHAIAGQSLRFVRLVVRLHLEAAVEMEQEKVTGMATFSGKARNSGWIQLPP